MTTNKLHKQFKYERNPHLSIIPLVIETKLQIDIPILRILSMISVLHINPRSMVDLIGDKYSKYRSYLLKRES